MNLVVKPKGMKEQRQKRQLAPLALQEQLHGPQDRNLRPHMNGQLAPEWSDAMRGALRTRVAELIAKDFPNHVAQIASLDEATGPNLCGKIFDGKRFEDDSSAALRVIGGPAWLDVENPSGHVATFRYSELLPEFRKLAGEAVPGETSTTTPAGIRRNDPEAQLETLGLVSPAKANGKPAKGAAMSPDKRTGDESFAALPVEAFPLKTFERHPDNRELTPAEVEELAVDLKANKQREPILARRLPGGKLQVLWGEKRWLAAKKAGLEVLYARVTECDDATALELVASGNKLRSDFNPIQKARLVKRMCEKGKTREAAANAVGLDCGASASNLLRLLELPELWQKRVASGELPESFARIMVSYSHVTSVMNELDRRYRSKNEWESNAFQRRQNLESAIKSAAKERTRRLDGTKIYYGYEYSKQLGYDAQGDYPCLLTKEQIAEHREQLNIQRLTVTTGKGKTEEVEVATNVKLFDQLQCQAIKKKYEAKAKGKAAAAGRAADGGGKPKAKTPAQLAIAAKERQGQLESDIADWRDSVMRGAIQTAILDAPRPKSKADGTATLDLRLLKLLLSFAADRPCVRDGYEVENVFFGQLGAELNSMQSEDMWELLQIKLAGGGDAESLAQWSAMLCGWLVGGDAKHAEPAALSQYTIAALFGEWGCDMAAVWRELYAAKDPRLEEFYQLHRKDELAELGTELGVHFLGSVGKEGMIKQLCDRLSPLPLPQVLRPKVKRVKSKKGAK